jgi:DNA-binding response OmpR family regulator
MTANAFAEDRTRCLDAGMNAFLIKPFEPDALFANVLRAPMQRHIQAEDLDWSAGSFDRATNTAFASIPSATERRPASADFRRMPAPQQPKVPCHCQQNSASTGLVPPLTAS